MRAISLLIAFALVGALATACGVHLLTPRGPIPAPPDGGMRIASLNVHYIVVTRTEGRWSLADWQTRKGALAAALGDLDADIVAFQEMESFAGGHGNDANLARDHLLAAFPAYAAAATGDWRTFPATQPIFYRRDRLAMRDEGWFFFSETPDRLYSRTFDGSWPAFASWAEFVPRDGGPPLRVMNVHFDYRSAENRRRSAALVRDRLAPVVAEGMPTILVGDLNALRGTRPLRTIAEAGLRFARVPGATFHADRGINILPAIDHVALSPGLETLGGPYVLRRAYGGRWPSDHYPIALDFRPAP